MSPLRERSAPSGGDFDDFASFYRATAAQTLRAACRMTRGDHHLAHDVTQDAYVAMLRCWPARQGISLDDNRRYVMGIMSNKVIDWYRRRYNRNVEFDDEFDCAVEETGLTEVVDELSVLGAVRNLIDGQPARRRAVAVLFFLQGWGHKEVAVTLGMSESTVRTHVERLRNLLKPFIDQIHEIDRGGERP
jgi:RNA polymerase sigma factor (sigma-70 family)